MFVRNDKFELVGRNLQERLVRGSWASAARPRLPSCPSAAADTRSIRRCGRRGRLKRAYACRWPASVRLSNALRAFRSTGGCAGCTVKHMRSRAISDGDRWLEGLAGEVAERYGAVRPVRVARIVDREDGEVIEVGRRAPSGEVIRAIVETDGHFVACLDGPRLFGFPKRSSPPRRRPWRIAAERYHVVLVAGEQRVEDDPRAVRHDQLRQAFRLARRRVRRRIARPLTSVTEIRRARRVRVWCEWAREHAARGVTPPVAFHVSPVAARANIRREGLDTTQRRRWTWIDRRPGVYVWGSLSDALECAWNEADHSAWDVWAIAVNGLPMVTDRNENGSWIITTPVGPDRLACLGPPPPGRPFETRLVHAAERGWPVQKQLARRECERGDQRDV